MLACRTLRPRSSFGLYVNTDALRLRLHTLEIEPGPGAGSDEPSLLRQTPGFGGNQISAQKKMMGSVETTKARTIYLMTNAGMIALLSARRAVTNVIDRMFFGQNVQARHGRGVLP